MNAVTTDGGIAPAIVEWFARSARDLPWRRPGFSPWGTLVSEIMLQQTPVVRVVPRLAEWLERWPTPASLASVPAGDAVRAWERLGYPRRALNLHAAAVAITEHHGGVVPDDVPSLLALPGIGEYTSRAVAVFAYGKRHPVVDTNVRRVIARAIGGQAEAGPPSTTRDLREMDALLPQSDVAARAFNGGMMELGAIVCTARAPRCDSCPIADACAWRSAGYPPHSGARRPGQKRYEGSDRQVRGLVLARLRASDTAVTDREIEDVWADDAQRARAIASLAADGLIVRAGAGYQLP